MEPETTQSTPKKSIISTPAAIVTGAVIIALAIIFTRGTGNKVATNPTAGNNPAAGTFNITKDILAIKPNEHIRGDINAAKVAIIEYSDSDCPFCERFHTTLQQVVTDYKGDVAWAYRNFPLASLHPNATTEAVALECAADLGGSEVFNKYLDLLIATTLEPTPESNKALTTLAVQQGIDASLFESCIKDPAASARVAASVAEAQSIGARGTPFSIAVNIKSGKYEVIQGAYPIEQVKEIVDRLLK